MSREEDFKLLKIKTIVLKVNIHCDGCKREVKKLLQRTEGVYTVSIDAEHQKATVSGNVHPANLIKRLAKAGKHAELYHPKSNTTTNINTINNKTQALLQGLKAFKDQHNIKRDQPSNKDKDDEGSIDIGEKNTNRNKNKNKNRQKGEEVEDVGDLRGHASAMLANLRGLNNSTQQNNTMHMQQQAMCSRSPQVPQYTTGCYNNNYYHPYYCQWTPDVGTHHFSDCGEGSGYDDQSISSCSVM